MRAFIMTAVTAAALFSAGCWVGPRERPVARYHQHYEYRRVGPPPPVYYEHRGYYRDDRGYRDRYRYEPYRYYR